MVLHNSSPYGPGTFQSMGSGLAQVRLISTKENELIINSFLKRKHQTLIITMVTNNQRFEEEIIPILYNLSVPSRVFLSDHQLLSYFFFPSCSGSTKENQIHS